MSSFFIDSFLFNKYVYLIFSFTLLLVSLFWNQIFGILNLKKYNAIQKIHENETPRLGGFLIYVSLFFVYFFDIQNEQFMNAILISSLPTMVIAVKEDFYHNTSPTLRLLSMFLSIFIFIYIFKLDFPSIDIFNIFNIKSNIFYMLFYSFSIIVFMNGCNLIDGLNGLLGFSLVSQLLTLILLSFNIESYSLLPALYVVLIFLLIFLIFNFIFGKLFMGDFGAYFFGFLISILTIQFFNENSNYPTWLAVLILIYPCFELLFSFFRKKYIGISPFEPDQYHLHYLMLRVVRQSISSPFVSNSVTTIALIIFWIFPFIFVSIVNVYNAYLIILGIVIFCLIYLIAYLIFKKITFLV